MIEEEEFEFDPVLYEVARDLCDDFLIEIESDLASSGYDTESDDSINETILMILESEVSLSSHLAEGNMDEAYELIRYWDPLLAEFAIKFALSASISLDYVMHLQRSISLCIRLIVDCQQAQKRQQLAQLTNDLLKTLADSNDYFNIGVKSKVLGRAGARMAALAKQVEHKRIQTLAQDTKSRNPLLSNNAIAGHLIDQDQVSHAKSSILRILRGKLTEKENC